ncbi:MAG: mltG [Xanthomonadaceae bacterium]|nr:mltG [Xanthomonadaceae bacterium]
MSSRKSKRSSGWFLLLAVLLAGVGGYWAVTRYLGFADAPIPGLHAGETLQVERGDSFAVVIAKLQNTHASRERILEWQALGRQMGVAGKLQVGEYALEPGTTPRMLLLRMREGKVISYRFTIVEGWNIHELRAALARAQPLRHDAGQLDDVGLMKALGHPRVHPEGRFLPETYVYTRGDGELSLLHRAFDAMTVALDKAWTSRAKDLALHSPGQALILASIVEKETGIASERPDIAGVFLRRLQSGMRLQTDPTVIYGMGAAYAGNIRRVDLLTDTPYNTYTRDGLPPTPIAMPGMAALQAATHPAAGDALYFVAIGDGSGRHVFTRSLAEHQAAVQQYLQRYRARESSTQ